MSREKSDIVYVWKAVGIQFNDKPVYKIGVTTEKNGLTRIKKVASKANLDYEMIAYVNVGVENTEELESALKSIGESPDMSQLGLKNIDGKTEFAALNHDELNLVLLSLEGKFDIREYAYHIFEFFYGDEYNYIPDDGFEDFERKLRKECLLNNDS